MFYACFNDVGEIVKITNEIDNSHLFVEIPFDLYDQFGNGNAKLSDYSVIKTDRYKVIKKDVIQKYEHNIYILPDVQDLSTNSIYITQDKNSNKWKIWHTFDEYNLNNLSINTKKLQADKNFYVTKKNNANVLLDTLTCKLADYIDTEYVFPNQYYDDVMIVTRPDFETYCHYVGESVE